MRESASGASRPWLPPMADRSCSTPGPVPRKYPERNWTMGGKTGEVRTADGSIAEDTVPEDQSLVLDTDRGLVVITGCAHAGIINTLDYARHRVREAPAYAVIGGLHL